MSDSVASPCFQYSTCDMYSNIVCTLTYLYRETLCAGLMYTCCAEDLDEDGTVLTASPDSPDSPEDGKGGSHTPDLLADDSPSSNGSGAAAPANAADLNSPDLTGLRLFPAFQRAQQQQPNSSAFSEQQSPQSIHGFEVRSDSSHGPAASSRGVVPLLQKLDSGNAGHTESGSSSAGKEGRSLSPRGAYSTVAAHVLDGADGSRGHELPACFTSPPTSPPQSARVRKEEPPISSISLNAGPLHEQPPSGAASAAADKGSGTAAAAASSSQTADGANTRDGRKRMAGHPISGFRDLFAPVGGLLMGAFSSEPSQPSPSSHQPSTALPGQEPSASEDVQHCSPVEDGSPVLAEHLPIKELAPHAGGHEGQADLHEQESPLEQILANSSKAEASDDDDAFLEENDDDESAPEDDGLAQEGIGPSDRDSVGLQPLPQQDGLHHRLEGSSSNATAGGSQQPVESSSSSVDDQVQYLNMLRASEEEGAPASGLLAAAVMVLDHFGPGQPSIQGGQEDAESHAMLPLQRDMAAATAATSGRANPAAVHGLQSEAAGSGSLPQPTAGEPDAPGTPPGAALPREPLQRGSHPLLLMTDAADRIGGDQFMTTGSPAAGEGIGSLDGIHQQKIAAAPAPAAASPQDHAHIG